MGIHDYRERESTWTSRFLVGAFIAAALVAVCVLGWFVISRVAAPRLLMGYTDAVPRPMPVVEVTEDQLTYLGDAVDAFVDAVKEGGSPPPLNLSESDLNALIQRELRDDNEKWTLYLRPRGGLIEAEVSLPLEDLANTPLRRLANRYLSGTAVLRIGLSGGKLEISVESFTMDGKGVPKWILDALVPEGELERLGEDPDVIAVTEKLDSLTISNGAVSLVPRRSRTQ